MQDLLAQSTFDKLKAGTIVPGVITEIRANEVVVDIGGKAEGVIPANEFSELPDFGNPWLVVCSNFLVYGALALVFRTMSLDNADRWLGRSSDSNFSETRSATAPALET